MKKGKIAITIGTLCLILSFAISVQIRTMQNEDSIVYQNRKNNDLRNQVLKWKEKYNTALLEFDKFEKELEQLREQATQNDSSAVEKEQQLKKNNMFLGLTEVRGDGVIITLKDNDNVTRQSIGVLGLATDYLVHDFDLYTIVNELWNAKAEAISINGQRIVSSSSITCEGNVIKLNGEKIGTPFVIKAIGSSELLYGAITRIGGYYEFIGDCGVLTDIEKSNNISIPKYNGVLSVQYIKNK